MGFRLALISFIMLLVAPAHAGPFDFVIDAGRLAMVLPPLFSATRISQKLNVYYIPVVPSGSDCAPNFVPGNDGIFRRTPYCHKSNPTRGSGFLERGYDVPASFLSGMTADDALARWKGARFASTQFFGSTLELPKELLMTLNVKAAEAWEKILSCAEGNADQAREMYRVGKIACAEESLILSLLKEIRTSLPTLAASLEVAPFLSEEAMNRKLEEIMQRQATLPQSPLVQNPEAYFREANELEKRRNQIIDWRIARRFSSLAGIINQNLPKMPRLHPLLAQVIVEELLNLIKPNESPSSLARRLKDHPDRYAYLAQLILWINAVEDRDCASFGLWPSAARTALDSLGQSVQETLTDYKDLRTTYRAYIPVICLQNPHFASASPELAAWAPSSVDYEGSLKRLPSLYTENRFTVWRELLEVRERQLDALKR